MCGSAQLAHVASSISPEEHAKNSLTANRDLFVRVLTVMAFELQLGNIVQRFTPWFTFAVVFANTFTSLVLTDVGRGSGELGAERTVFKLSAPGSLLLVF